MLQACLVVPWLVRAELDRHQTWSWSYRCLVKHLIKLESFLPGFLVEEYIKQGGWNIFDIALFLTFSGCCRGIGRKSPGRKNNVSPSWHKIVENARSSLSYVESVQDVGVTPSKILGRGPQFSFVKKYLPINCITCSPVFLSICSSILPPS